jgi:hypothetical protein
MGLRGAVKDVHWARFNQSCAVSVGCPLYTTVEQRGKFCDRHLDADLQPTNSHLQNSDLQLDIPQGPRDKMAGVQGASEQVSS